MNECKELRKLPASIGNLNSLCSLLMENTAVTELPESFGMLSSLMILKMRKKPLKYFSAQEKLAVLPSSFINLSSLEELDARACRISGKISDDFEKLSLLETLKLGYNNFCSLPSSLKGLSLLKKLSLPHSEQLVSLPPFPSSLEELDSSNCISLESICDISNLENLGLLNLMNCEKVMDIPGLECLKSLKSLYMSGCKACSSAVKRRLSKDCLSNIYNTSIPGSKIPDWYSQQVISFSEGENRDITAVIVCAVISLNHEILDELPVVPAIQTRILKLNKPIVNFTLPLLGVPKTNEEQIHLCRFPRSHQLVSGWKTGYKLEVREHNPPISRGVELKKCGISPGYENDDDWVGDEESLDETQQSASEKLAKFFNSMEEDL
ncbi:hypothetical protein RCOM_0699250 [Ricinus communis]|uniref:Leucine-rich repeat-containing protein n=1 Tax=Ricinus communis TaxID=3988 RepID=B9S2G1_RICCO|nr:hypothetical protein RCOM_0699250 [Ricinus communis]